MVLWTTDRRPKARCSVERVEDSKAKITQEVVVLGQPQKEQRVTVVEAMVAVEPAKPSLLPVACWAAKVRFSLSSLLLATVTMVDTAVRA